MTYVDLFVIAAFTLMYFSARGISENMPTVFEFTVRSLTRAMNRNVVVSYFVGTLLSFFSFSGLRASLTALGFVNSGLLKLPQAATFLLGSFLGIGLASWTLILFPGVFKFALILFGLLFTVFGLETRWQHIGKLFYFLGTTLLGLELFIQSLNTNGSSIVFYLSQIQLIGKPGFALLGLLFTILFRSGFSVLGIIVALLVTHKIAYIHALYMVAGIYLGKALPLFMFTRNAHRETKLAVAIMLMSAILGVAVVFVILDFFNLGLEGQASPDLSSIIGFYNIGSLIIGIVGLMHLHLFIKLLNIWFPKLNELENRKIKIFSAPSLLSSIVLLENAQQETEKLFGSLKSVVESSTDYLKTKNKIEFEKVKKFSAIIDRIRGEIQNFSQKSNEFSLNAEQAQLVSKIQLLTYEIDKISQVCMSTLETFDQNKILDPGSFIQTLDTSILLINDVKLFGPTKSDLINLKSHQSKFNGTIRGTDHALYIFADHLNSICEIIIYGEVQRQFDFTSLLESKKRAIGL